MSVSDALLSGAAPAASGQEPALRPPWLRPLALCVVVALHAALFLVVKGQPAPLTPLSSIEVALEPEGDSPEDQQKVEQVIAAEPPPAPAPQPVEAAELTAPLPQVVAPEAIPLPVEKPKPVAKPKPVVEDDDRPTPAELREQKRKREQIAERRQKAREARQASRRGVAGGNPASGVSRGDYAGLLAAELRRHQFYPSAARAAGVTGSVGVAFSVGASGRVVNQAITSSSGNAALDGAARAMMSAVHAPPPPGGHFSTSTTIRFHLNN